MDIRGAIFEQREDFDERKLPRVKLLHINSLWIVKELLFPFPVALCHFPFAASFPVFEGFLFFSLSSFRGKSDTIACFPINLIPLVKPI